MTGLPPGLAEALRGALGAQPIGCRPLGGGMICRAASVTTTSGEVFVKWLPGAPPGFFASEADGLGRLAAAGHLRVPAVLAWRDAGETAESGPSGAPPYLALEHIAQAPSGDTRAAHRAFGESLAAQHAERPAEGCAYGLPRDNYLGLLPQQNAPSHSWSAFYRDRRLAPQVAIARSRGLLPARRERLLSSLLDRVEGLLADADPHPSLLHGDLWSGNLLMAAQGPVVIDPAVYYGDREIELAYMELFSGFAPEALEAYRAACPLDPGYGRRRALYQLYPLLVHLNHFGEQYGPDVETACRSYLT